MAAKKNTRRKTKNKPRKYKTKKDKPARFESVFDKMSFDPEYFKSMSGISVEQFNNLYPKYEKEFRKRHRQSPKNKRGAGRKDMLCIRDKMLMFLIYVRKGSTQDELRGIFDMHRSTASKNNLESLRIMLTILPVPDRIRKSLDKASPYKLRKMIPGLVMMVDATEVEMHRPKDKDRQKGFYSGKSKMHARKTQIITSSSGVILNATRSYPGSKTDITLFEEDHPKKLLKKAKSLLADLGYQGIQTKFPKYKSLLPVKRKKGRKLTREEKKHNKELSRKRVIVENAFAFIKKYRIFGNKESCKGDRYDAYFELVCGLVNYNTAWRLSKMRGA